MKIHQLPMGARFEYQGEEYVKTAALFATGKAGQRLIPKYAELKPLDPAGTAADSPVDAASSHAGVVKAFAAFCLQCGLLVPADRRDEFETVRAGFLETLTRLRNDRISP